jgi:uncharacterized repeat protein (TIGR01451 family)
VQTNNSAAKAGAAYVFTRSGTTWSQQAYLKASNTGADDNFGGSVALSGDTVMVGAYGEPSGTTGIDGYQGDNYTNYAGAVYSFNLLPSGPNLTLTKTVSPASAAPGDAITYTVAFTNTGVDPATAVVITDSLPAALPNPAWSSSGVTLTPIPGQTYAWTAPDLAQNDGGVITLTGVLSSPLAAGSISNTVTVEFSGTLKTATATLTVPNLAPQAGADEAVTAKNTAVTVSPLTNDSDPNGDTLQVTRVDVPAHGTAVISGATQVVYTPTLNFSGRRCLHLHRR